jgi:type II secretory pathway component PulF
MWTIDRIWRIDQLWGAETSTYHILWVTLSILCPIIFYLALIRWVYRVLRAPLYRQQRACLFLDLLESGIQEGHSPEHTIVTISHSDDPVLGIDFHVLAAHLSNGMRLGEALHLVPSLLPPRVTATLQVGEQSGNFAEILTACRKTLTSAPSHSLRATNYVIATLLLLSPAIFAVPFFLMNVIAPKFYEITSDYGGSMPPVMQLLVQYPVAVASAQILMLVGAILAAMVYGGVPRILRPMASILKPLTDRIAWKLSWRRKRLLRDFSALLAILLDANLPEVKAVQLAAAGTNNRVVIRHGDAITAQIEQGVPLTKAMSVLDDGGEFCWRVTNATHGRSGFQVALAGWHEALDATAYQQEQTASQIVTTALVLANGVFVGAIAIAVFQALTSIVWTVSLW